MLMFLPVPQEPAGNESASETGGEPRPAPDREPQCIVPENHPASKNAREILEAAHVPIHDPKTTSGFRKRAPPALVTTIKLCVMWRR